MKINMKKIVPLIVIAGGIGAGLTLKHISESPYEEFLKTVEQDKVERRIDFIEHANWLNEKAGGCTTLASRLYYEDSIFDSSYRRAEIDSVSGLRLLEYVGRNTRGK